MKLGVAGLLGTLDLLSLTVCVLDLSGTVVETESGNDTISEVSTDSSDETSFDIFMLSVSDETFTVEMFNVSLISNS